MWKIVFNIGREAGTWMPGDWGASGDRLLFQCTVHFTGDDTTVLSTAEQRDEFFHGGAARALLVADAFVLPHGVGRHSVGRRALPVKPVGAYRVCRGQGPAGTDIVRLYIELTDAVVVAAATDPLAASDVSCPAGRVYGTCGYFPTPAAASGDSASSRRDAVQQKYHDALRAYEAQTDAEGHHNNNGMLRQWHRMHEAWQAKQVVEQLAAQLQLARQRDPEKSLLRYNRAQTVGLTREGGVCCKVRKGLALEYHILGRMQVGCVDDDSQHHQLRHHQHQQQLLLDEQLDEQARMNESTTSASL